MIYIMKKHLILLDTNIKMTLYKRKYKEIKQMESLNHITIGEIIVYSAIIIGITKFLIKKRFQNG